MHSIKNEEDKQVFFFNISERWSKKSVLELILQCESKILTLIVKDIFYNKII